MKKITSLVLVLVMVLAFAGCTENKNEAPTSVSQEPTQTEALEETVMEAETENQEGGFL